MMFEIFCRRFSLTTHCAFQRLYVNVFVHNIPMKRGMKRYVTSAKTTAMLSF